MPVTSDEALRTILASKTIAVVGCSSSPGKAAHDVPKYLLEQGYEIIPINPFADEIFGRVAYDRLEAVPATTELDVVCIFRPSEELSEIVDSVLEREDQPVVWTQLGIVDEAAAARANAAGNRVVQDRCLKVEHRRLSMA